MDACSRQQQEPAEGEQIRVATQASEFAENPRSSRIEGSATPTIVTSRTIIR